MKCTFSLVFSLIFVFIFSQENIIPTSEAVNYVNKKVWIQGIVVSQKLSSQEKHLNYMNLDKAYPNQIFTIVITNSHLKKKEFNLESLANKKVKFFGKIIWYEDKKGAKILEIFNPEKIEIVE